MPDFIQSVRLHDLGPIVGAARATLLANELQESFFHALSCEESTLPYFTRKRTREGFPGFTVRSQYFYCPGSGQTLFNRMIPIKKAIFNKTLLVLQPRSQKLLYYFRLHFGANLAMIAIDRRFQP